MALTFVFGRSGYGKTKYLLEHALSEKKTGYILVPEQINFEYERKLIRMIPDTITKGISVITFSTLARKVFYETGGDPLEILTASGKALLIYRIMKELGRELSVFNNGELTRGLVNAISVQIRELKNSSVTCEEISGLSEKMKEHAMLRNKLKDLAKIYGKYEELIKDRYSDNEDELIKLAAKMPESRMFSGCAVYIDAFSSFSSSEMNVIEALMKNGNDIFVSLTGDPAEFGHDLPVWKTVEKTAKKIRGIAEKNGTEIFPDRIISVTSRTGSKHIGHIEKNMFGYSYSVYRGAVEGIRLAKFQDPYSEAEAAAKEIRKLVRTGGLRYNDISVVVSDMPSYEIILSELFGIYDIPCYFDSKLDLTKHPLAAYITNILKAVGGGYRYADMAEAMKSAYSPLSHAEADMLENHVLANGIRGMRWHEDEYFDDEDIHDAWRKFISPVMMLHSGLKEDMEGRSVAKTLYDFITASGLAGITEALASEHMKNGEYLHANRTNQAYTALINVLDMLYDIFGSVRLTRRDLSEILTCAFSEHSLASIPFGTDEIFVGDLKRSKKEDVSALFILGATDGSFLIRDTGNPVFSEIELLKLIENGFCKLADPGDMIYDNEMLLYLIMTRPKWYLCVSSPMADMTGKSLAQSQIYSRVSMIFENIPIFTEPAAELRKLFVPDDEYTGRSLINEISLELRKKKAGMEIDPSYISLFVYLKTNVKDRMFDIAAKGLSYSNHTERIDEETLGRIFGPVAGSSVTRLQKFRLCPFSFFMEYGLAAKDRKIWEFTSADAGTFVHDVLERFQLKLLDSGITMSGDDVGRILFDAMDEVLERGAKGILDEKGIFEGIRRDLGEKLLTTCRIIHENMINSRFRPLMFEAAFGRGSEYPPIRLENEHGEETLVSGKIDRVDVYRRGEDEYYTIFDYKTGNRTFSLSDVYHCTDLQLPVYLKAVIESSPKARSAGLFYFHVKDPVIKGDPDMTDEEIEDEIKKQHRLSGIALADAEILDCLDGAEKKRGSYRSIPVQISGDGFSRFSKVASREQFDMLFDFVEKKLKELTSGIYGGNYEIRPVKRDMMKACDYCDYMKICQFDITTRQNRYDVIKKIPDDEFWEKAKGTDKDGEVES